MLKKYFFDILEHGEPRDFAWEPESNPSSLSEIALHQAKSQAWDQANESLIRLNGMDTDKRLSRTPRLEAIKILIESNKLDRSVKCINIFRPDIRGAKIDLSRKTKIKSLDDLDSLKFNYLVLTMEYSKAIDLAEHILKSDEVKGNELLSYATRMKANIGSVEVLRDYDNYEFDFNVIVLSELKKIAITQNKDIVALNASNKKLRKELGELKK